MGGKPTDEYSRIETGPRGPAFQVGDIEGFSQPAAVCPQMEDSDLWPCPEDTAFVYGLPADEDWPAEQGPSGLDYAWQSAKKRTAADRAKAQQDVAAAVAAELNLVLRGKPYSRSVLHYATGHYADLRDVLLAHEGRADRRQAWQAWLEGYRDGPDFQTVWAVAKTVTDARDAHRQSVREAAVLKKAQQDVARAGAFFQQAKKTAAAGPDEDWPDLPKPDPQVFLTTLKTRHEGGRSDEYVYFCPMTRGKSDPAGLAKLARRYAKQCEWEQTEGGRSLFQIVLTDEDWKRQAAAWRQQKKRTGQTVAWQAYRTEGGRVTVFHDSLTAGGAPVAADPKTLYSLIHALLTDAPDGKKTRTSEGFGGAYEGSRGDGRARHAKRQGQAGQWELVGQFVTEGRGLRQAAALLKVDLNSKLRGRAQVDHEDALLALLEAGYTMTPRKAHAAALSVFDVLLASEDPPMSHLTYIEDLQEDCTLSVTEDPIDEDWPVPSGKSDPQPQPIYLWGEGDTW